MKNGITDVEVFDNGGVTFVFEAAYYLLLKVVEKMNYASSSEYLSVLNLRASSAASGAI